MPRYKIDEGKLIELVRFRTPDGKKYTQQEIADKMGVTRVAVARRIKQLDPTLLKTKNVEEFIENRAKIYAEKEMAILDALRPSVIMKASARQIIAMVKDLQQMQRIENGESTENVAVLHKHIHIDAKEMERLKLLASAVDEQLIDEGDSEEYS